VNRLKIVLPDFALPSLDSSEVILEGSVVVPPKEILDIP